MRHAANVSRRSVSPRAMMSSSLRKLEAGSGPVTTGELEAGIAQGGVRGVQSYTRA